ncbi:anhydro-N-acetylmuramic acid kinase [Pirellulimonas nuda]|uniref:anhydro-N-acetylmuramic acid kinase n=1 Tax=Pirellulimonas nuda TaxID=2528009 RepID=UPI00119DAC0E|nr:anhydro-N-acetylmuramic acid kinase [Pirellulimonas nuda]
MAVGLMSGTSADGVDAALLHTDGESVIDVRGGITLPYDDDMRSRLLDASQHDAPTVELLRLERDVTMHHAAAVAKLLSKAAPSDRKPEVVGFHGHTIRHVPRENLTMQIGNPWLLSQETGLRVVTDFRRNDIALGGQGAPLASMFHQSLFVDEAPPIGVLNLGGVANITWLGPNNTIIAGDTGPGCGLLDEWVQEMAGMPHDRDGKLALAGEAHREIVEEALAEEFFTKPLPKSADRFEFDHIDVSMLSIEDGAATLCAVTAGAIYAAARKLPAMPSTLWVTGGGVHHPLIMKMLADFFGSVRCVSERGQNPDTLEAECFAWLAVRHLRGLPLTMPETTGCSEATCGGTVTCGCPA